MYDLSLLEQLEEKTLTSILNSNEYKELLKNLTKNIIISAKEAENEATVVNAFNIQFYGFINRVLGLSIIPESEQIIDKVRHVSTGKIEKGRIDSKIGALVIEFKHFSKLKTLTQQDKASKQLTDYLRGLEEKQYGDYYGVITDGISIKFLTLTKGRIVEEPFQRITFRHIDRLIKSTILLKQKALTSGNLINDFYANGKDSIALDLVFNLYESLRIPSRKTTIIFEEWKELFRLAHDDKSKQQAIEDRRRALSELIGHKVTENIDEYKIIYALQTSYAIIIKLLAFSILSKIRFKVNLLDYASLANTSSEALRSKISEIEEGGIFKDLGMFNLFEGDFFSWYSSESQWNDNIADNIRTILALLSKYEEKSLFPMGNKVQDLFQEFYMKLMPEKVRHSLGEFYTPGWLADNVVSEALSLVQSTKDWKGLDPCAGSGTFLISMIRRVIEETSHLAPQEQLQEVLARVKGIDLNPLAVLTARINYFINISHLIEDNLEFEIPVYLGDASYVPEKVYVDEIKCMRYSVGTANGNIEVLLPIDLISNSKNFIKVMIEFEEIIKELDVLKAYNLIIRTLKKPVESKSVKQSILNLCEKLVELEKNGWDGIWTRVVRNFITTTIIGEFDIIVGNPPWIDWKNLPEGYRERIKSLCISRHLFSGDKRTGGINLNICALITNVACQRWLQPKGTLAFLMPQAILFQQSYEGFRKLKLDNGSNLYFQKFTDWIKAGHPFKPVTEKFMTYFINDSYVDYSKGLPATKYILRKGNSLEKYRGNDEFSEMQSAFIKESFVIGRPNKNSSKFSYAGNYTELEKFSKIAGECPYIGREGIEFYPQELFLLKIDKKIQGPQTPDIIYLTNYQNGRSKHKVPMQTVPLEKKMLHPLTKGTDISRFHIQKSEYIVPFPYLENNPKIPVNYLQLKKESKLLANYFKRNRSVLEAQTNYSDRIVGNSDAPFYALARVGKYSFANYHVVFRDNTRWVAAVSTPMDTDWGGIRLPMFQNHAVSICENSKGEFITEDEAHYICAILNAPIVQKYILNSSDSRSFKVRPPIKMVEFDENNPLHWKLVELSRTAHANHNNKTEMKKIDALLDQYYIDSLN